MAIENMEPFLVGYWETDDNLYFKMTETTSEYSNKSHHVYYNLPVPDKSHKYFDMQDNKLIFTNGGGKDECDVFKFTLDEESPDVIYVYCYEDGQTYTLYRKN